VRASLDAAKRRRRLWSIVGSCALFGAALTGSSSALVTGSASGFESGDGNMVLNDTASGNSTDWNCFVGTDGFQAGTPNSNCAVKTGATHIVADPGGVETGLTNGTKFDDNCPTLETKNTPPKDDFTDIAEYNDFASNGDAFFYGATIRSTANGNSSGNVEFRKSSTSGCRSAGDRLLAYEFLNGGSGLDFHGLTWLTVALPNGGGNAGKCYVKQDALPCWGAKVITPDAAVFEGHSNKDAAIAAADNGISGTALAINQFAEFGVDLTSALALTGCTAFPQQLWESRSSGSSFTSNPEDVEISNRSISNCGSITIVKDSVGGNDTFPYTTTGTGLSNFNLVTTGSTAATPGTDSKTFDTLAPGSYTVTEGDEPTDLNWSFTSLHCTTGGVVDGTNNEKADITLAAGATVTCTYTNTHTVQNPSITTLLSKSSGTVPVTLHDSATLTGASGNAGGTVTYSVYNESTCTTLATGAQVSGTPGTVLVTNGHVPDSSDVTVNVAGDYYFQAVYSGDVNNATATSACLDEHLAVAQAGPSAATTQDLLPNDTFTLSGGFNPTGTVTFKLFGPSNPTCSGTSGLVFPAQTVTLSGTATGGTASTSNTTHVSAAGTYRWLATYSGDTNNSATSSPCGAESFTITYP
jgi:hypothetical protein